MKFIKPSVEIITEPDLFKRIEIAARTCYKSEDKITDDSAEKMVKALIKRGHESPLEHSSIAVRFDPPSFDMFEDVLEAYRYEPGLPHFLHVSGYYPVIVSGNLRAWRSLAKKFPDEPILCRLFRDHPGFFDIPLSDWSSDDGMGYGIVETPADDPCHHIITARFICDRGVSHELVRHRLASFSQESTRYVNYKEGLTFVEPWWWPQQESSDTALIRMSCQAAEDAYCSLINSGASPQKARCVLPNMLKTEVVVTGTVEYWQKHVLPLRLSKAAHPDIRRLMEMFCEQLGWNPDDFR